MKIRNNTGPRTVSWGFLTLNFAIWMMRRAVEHIVPFVRESWRTIQGHCSLNRSERVCLKGH